MIREYLVLFANNIPPSDVRPNGSQRVKELHDSDSYTVEEESLAEEQYQEAPTGDGANRENQTITHSSPRRLRTEISAISPRLLTQELMPSCPEDCHCACHTGRRRRRNAGWAGNLLHYLGVQYDLPSRYERQDSRCICDGHRWYLKYRPPAWLEARVWLLSGSFGAAGPMYSLRAARVVSLSDIIWTRILQPAQAMRYWIADGAVVYPDDCDERGRDVVEVSQQCPVKSSISLIKKKYIINRHSFDVLQLLLMEWKNILPTKGLSR